MRRSTTPSTRPACCVGRPGVAINDKSGAAGIVLWLRSHYPEMSGGVAKSDPRIRRVVEAVQAGYDDGRITSLSDGEVDALVVAEFGRG